MTIYWPHPAIHLLNWPIWIIFRCVVAGNTMIGTYKYLTATEKYSGEKLRTLGFNMCNIGGLMQWNPQRFRLSYGSISGVNSQCLPMAVFLHSYFMIIYGSNSPIQRINSMCICILYNFVILLLHCISISMCKFQVMFGYQLVMYFVDRFEGYYRSIKIYYSPFWILLHSIVLLKDIRGTALPFYIPCVGQLLQWLHWLSIDYAHKTRLIRCSECYCNIKNMLSMTMLNIFLILATICVDQRMACRKLS